MALLFASGVMADHKCVNEDTKALEAKIAPFKRAMDFAKQEWDEAKARVAAFESKIGDP